LVEFCFGNKKGKGKYPEITSVFLKWIIWPTQQGSRGAAMAMAMLAILERLRPKEVGGFVAYVCANATNRLYSLLSTREGILKAQCHEIFASGFFRELCSPRPLKITLGSFTGDKFANNGNDSRLHTP
jgi:hypothetical protein